MIDLTIPIKPVAKGRPRMTRAGHTYTPKKTLDAEKAIALYAKAQIKRPLEGAVSVKMVFNFLAPVSWSKKKREQAIGGLIMHTSKPDCTNLIKLVEDALNGIAYADDSAIWKVEAIKRYWYEDSIHVQIMEV